MRKLVWVSGNKNWCIESVDSLIRHISTPTQNIIYCGADEQTLTTQQINIGSTSKRAEIEKYLGTQCNGLIINCFDGFNPDLFCALCGTVKSPGIIFLLTPPVAQWPLYPDPDYINLCSYPYTHKDINGRFIQYLINSFASLKLSKSILSICEEKDSSSGLKNAIYSELSQLLSDPVSKQTTPQVFSKQHKQLIKSVQKMLDGQLSGVLILSGKRGRGKSSILGIALNHYAKNNDKPLNVSVVSQTRSNVQPIFKSFAQNNDADVSQPLLSQSLCLSFSPPDVFIKSKVSLDLLIIDEAAAIPLPQLYLMLERYPDVILSTTTDGYEGTGMGFTSKLDTYLAANNSPVTQIILKQSLRWPSNDAIEHLLQSTLLFESTETSEIESKLQKLTLSELEVEKLDRDKLTANSILIKQVFRLLSSAHYRTTPDDLRFMLDAPDITLWITKYKGKVIAAMMLGREGALPEELHEEIWLGKRRLRGHLLPQSLAAQCGFIQASRPVYKRIIRIAVYPRYQKLGIGKMLVMQAFKSDSKSNEVDFYGASFGFDTNLVGFWQALGLQPVKLGHRKNARSGAKSIIMLKPCSAQYTTLFNNVVKRHDDEMSYLCAHAELVTEMDHSYICNKQSAPEHSIQYNDQDRLDMYAFAFGNRQLAHCHWVLSKYANENLNTGDINNLLSAEQIKLLKYKILQNLSWKISADLLGYTGKNETMSKLRLVFSIIYNAAWGNKS